MPTIDDQVISDIYSDLHGSLGCSVDDILVDPTLRTQYIERLRQRIGDRPERQMLSRLLNLRKKSRLLRSPQPADSTKS